MNAVRTTPTPTATYGTAASIAAATAARSGRRPFSKSNARTAKRGGRSSHSRKKAKPTASPISGATPKTDENSAHVHPQHVVHHRVGRLLSSGNPRRQRPGRRVRTRTAGTSSTRSPGRTQLDGVRQAGRVGTVLRRARTDVQGLSASHRQRFLTGTPTGFRGGRSGYWCEQPRRQYHHNRPTVSIRGARPVRAVPRDDARNRPSEIALGRRSVQQSPDTLAVPTSDTPTQPRPRRTRPRPHRTVVRRGRLHGVRRDSTDVLDTHWSVRANEKTHNFWAFRAFVKRLACTAEEYSISVEIRSEAWIS